MPTSDRHLLAGACALLVAGCDRSGTGVAQEVPQPRGQGGIAVQAVPGVEPAPGLPCARGSAPLHPDCTLDRQPTAKGEVWTIRHPDGGFRRLAVEGNEVSAADGAEPLRADGDDVVIADERYRLPDD